MMEAIKRMAVKQESKLAHTIKMGKAVQSPRVSIRIFHAQLKGLATVATVADLLGDEKTDRRTTEIVDIIARKEQAEAERSTVCGETPVTAAVTPGATPRRGARPCRGCDALNMVGYHRGSVIALPGMSLVTDAVSKATTPKTV